MEQFLETILQHLFTGMGTVVGALIAYVAFFARRLIVEKIGEAQFDRLYKIVLTVVRAIEQEAQAYGWDGEKKREIALLQIYKMRDLVGLKASDEHILLLLESAVQTLDNYRVLDGVLDSTHELAG
jgi:hypothetical protein